MTSPRYAIYFTPDADSSLAEFGNTVFCRDAFNAQLPPPIHEHKSRAELVHKPCHYGFHATLKAPFELSKKKSEQALMDELDAFAQRSRAVTLGKLVPMLHGGFIALWLQNQIAVVGDAKRQAHSSSFTDTVITSSSLANRVAGFAMQCVTEFESFRAPMSVLDQERYAQRELSDRQRQLLQEFGYPLVADEFVFHMSLTSKIAEPDESLAVYFAQIYHDIVGNTDIVLDRLTLCWQPDRHTPFVQMQQWALHL